MADEGRTPIDDLVDILIYAPVGLLYEYEDVMATLVRRGKSQVQLARVLGTMAANRGGTASANAVVEAMASMVANRITEIGASIGLAPPSGEPSSPAASTGPGVSDRRSTTDVVDESATVDPEAPLPIASYDNLTAREIIGLLDELDAGQLARIRAHEEANRARKTVLGKLDRLDG